MFQILLWSPWKYRCGQRTVRMAVMACSQNQAVFARRRSELKLKLELVEEKQKLLDIRERKENARDFHVTSTREGFYPGQIYRATAPVHDGSAEVQGIRPATRQGRPLVLNYRCPLKNQEISLKSIQTIFGRFEFNDSKTSNTLSIVPQMKSNI
ncbi:hypothetical protein TNCV_3784271 [Trichonephila clavipes]|nr:hypothetical protein TNCV_3784271 [Trichonephila clavipes]